MIFKSVSGTRKRTEYETINSDIVQGEEGHHTDDEGETSAVKSTLFTQRQKASWLLKVFHLFDG